MPVFSDRIELKEDLRNLQLGKSFKFRIDKLGLELIGFVMKRNDKDRLEFTSLDTVYKIPRKKFVAGDKIWIQENEGESGLIPATVINREFSRTLESDFNDLNLEDAKNSLNFISINCEIEYSDKEMKWITIGIAPVEMEDRLIMYSKDNKLLLYSSWSRILIYEAHYKKISGVGYRIYRLFARKGNVGISKEIVVQKFRTHLHHHFLSKKWINKWSNDFMEKVKK